jgi:hypothetical protein
VTFTVDRTDDDHGVFDATVVREVNAGKAKGLMIAYERTGQEGDGSAMFTVSLMNPVSRGTVTAQGADFAMLSDGRDATAMAAVLSGAREVLRRAGFGEWTESGVQPVSHATSSCSRAIDAFGSVEGLANVRVADASALPWVPEDTPAASVTMIARRVATALGEVLS